MLQMVIHCKEKTTEKNAHKFDPYSEKGWALSTDATSTTKALGVLVYVRKNSQGIITMCNNIALLGQAFAITDYCNVLPHRWAG